MSKNNTLTARYQYYRDTETGNLNSPLSLRKRRPTTLSPPRTPYRSATRR